MILYSISANSNSDLSKIITSSLPDVKSTSKIDEKQDRIIKKSPDHLAAVEAFLRGERKTDRHFKGSLKLQNISSDLSIQDQRLSNGLRVIVKEDHRAPTVSHTVWYPVGSIDEPRGLTGISHMLEHMMFEGTEKVVGGAFSKQVAAAGGRENAFTSRDSTTYFQLIPKSRLRQMMTLEADRMIHLRMDPDVFEKERKVVMEERRLRIEDQPQSLFWERMQAHAHLINAYRHPIIGWMQDIRRYRVDHLRKWYEQHYQSSHAIVIVVGDVKASQVFKWAEEIYGRIPKRLNLEITPNEPQAFSRPSSSAMGFRDELPASGISRVVFKAATHLSELLFLYRAPILTDVANDQYPYALEVLAMILDGHAAARLPNELIKKQAMASSLSVGYNMIQRGPGQFVIAANPSEGYTSDKLEQAIRKQLQDIIEHGVTSKELQRAKLQLMAKSVYKRDSLFGQAMEIGRLEMSGLSYKDTPVILDRLQQVTGEDIRRVAALVFNDDQLTFGLLQPNGEKDNLVSIQNAKPTHE